MDQNSFSKDILAITLKSLEDYPDMEDYELDAVLIATSIYDPHNNSKFIDCGKFKIYDERSIPIILRILEIVNSNEEISPAWMAIVRYAVRLVKVIEKGIDEAVNFYHYHDDIILPQMDRRISDESLINANECILSIICENMEANISDIEFYFDLKYHEIVLPDWFDSPLMNEDYAKTQHFLIQFNRTFWSYARRHIKGERLFI